MNTRMKNFRTETKISLVLAAVAAMVWAAPSKASPAIATIDYQGALTYTGALGAPISAYDAPKQAVFEVSCPLDLDGSQSMLIMNVNYYGSGVGAGEKVYKVLQKGVSMRVEDTSQTPGWTSITGNYGAGIYISSLHRQYVPGLNGSLLMYTLQFQCRNSVTNAVIPIQPNNVPQSPTEGSHSQLK